MTAPLINIDDRDAMLCASRHLGHLVHVANSDDPPEPKFLAECAHYAADLVDIAMRLELELQRAEREEDGHDRTDHLLGAAE